MFNFRYAALVLIFVCPLPNMQIVPFGGQNSYRCSKDECRISLTRNEFKCDRSNVIARCATIGQRLIIHYFGSLLFIIQSLSLVLKNCRISWNKLRLSNGENMVGFVTLRHTHTLCEQIF